jgi:hypothetical protein
VASNANNLFIGNGPTFHTLDVSNATLPTTLSEYVVDGTVRDIVVRDSLAYVVNGPYFLIINVADPLNPSLLGQVYTPGSSFVALSDSFAFVGTGFHGLHLVDISDPSAPFVRDTSPPGTVSGLAAKGRIAYAGVSFGKELEIIDATNPDSLVNFTFSTGSIDVTAVHVTDDLLLLGMNTGDPLLRAYDISAPISPIFLSEVSLPGLTIRSIISRDTVAYVTKDSNIVAFSIANPTQLEILGLFYHSNGQLLGTGSALSGDALFTAMESGLLGINVADPDSLRFASFFPTAQAMINVELNEDNAFVSCGVSGLWILDISSPESVRTISNILTTNGAYDVLVSDTLLYMLSGTRFPGDPERGIWIASTADISQPIILSHYQGVMQATGISDLAIEGQLIYITQFGTPALSDTVLEIVDISEPRQPTQRGVFRSSVTPYRLAVE